MEAGTGLRNAMAGLLATVSLAAVLALPPTPSAVAALPVYGGLMTFPRIDSPSGPEEFSWEVPLAKGQELAQLDERTAEVLYESGHLAFEITAQPAHDSEGAAVPTTLIVTQPNVVTLVVHPRAGNPTAGGAPFAYPVLAGDGWEGGLRTETVQGPPDEAELHEQASPGSEQAPAGSGPVTVPIGAGVELTGGFKPTVFPEGGRRPVAVAFSMRVAARGGSRPPALSGFTLRLDRHVALRLAGLPTCNLGIQVETETEVQACKPAWIGGGRIDYSIALPESEEIKSSGRLQIFNGGLSGGGRRLWAYARVNYPTPAAVLIRGGLRRSRDHKYGRELVFSVPKIAGGSGSITSLSAVIHRRYRQGRRRLSVLSSTCPTERSYLGIEALFADGTHAGSQIGRTCTSSPGWMSGGADRSAVN